MTNMSLAELRKTLVPLPGYFLVVYDDPSIQPVEIPIAEFKGVGYGETVTMGRYSMRSDGKGRYPYRVQEDGKDVAEFVYIHVAFMALLFLQLEQLDDGLRKDLLEMAQLKARRVDRT